MAFLQEPERQPFLRVPAAAAGLIVILIVAHVARVLAPAGISGAIIANFAFYPARYSQAFLVAHGNYHQTFWDLAIPFVSYIFLHANLTHLAINCVWLLPFGAVTARRFGALVFFPLFLLCGVAGAIAHLFTHWGTMNYVIGASAAIAGLMGAAFRVLSLTDGNDSSRRSSRSGRAEALEPLAPIFSTRILVWSAIWITLNVVAGVTGLGTGPNAGPVAWQAHIGGYLAGVLLAGPCDLLRRRLRA